MKYAETGEGNRVPNSIFERHPKKTMFLIVIIGITGIIFGAERYLSWRKSPAERAGIVRYIRMRENPPLTEYRIIPNEHYMKATDHFVPEKHRLRVDREGFIYPSRIHEHPNLKLVFLGGSTTECLYVEEDKRFPFLVGRFLDEKGRKVNSYNGGVGGNDSMHSLNILINKVFRLNPDIVIIMHNINDLSVLIGNRTYWHDIPTRSMIIEETPKFALAGFARQLKNMLIPNLYIRMRDFIHILQKKLGFQQEEFTRSPGVKIIDENLLADTFRKNLQMLVDLCRDQGITPVLMTEASRLSERPDDVMKGGYGNLPPMSDAEYFQMRNLFDLFNKTIRDVGRKNGVLVIDLANKIPMEQQYIYDVIHFTDKGSALAAGIIADEMRQRLLR